MFCVTVVVEVLSNTDSDNNGVHAYAVTIVHMCIQKKKKKTSIEQSIFLLPSLAFLVRILPQQELDRYF